MVVWGLARTERRQGRVSKRQKGTFWSDGKFIS